jgi:hypothetical protein
MTASEEGLTKTYNRFHSPNERSAPVTKLRALQVELDKAVADAYGWSDLQLAHGFHDGKQGQRFTISPAARKEVLDRLLELNHQRYAEEAAKGLHEKTATRNKSDAAARKSKKASKGSPLLEGV